MAVTQQIKGLIKPIKQLMALPKMSPDILLSRKGRKRLIKVTYAKDAFRAVY